jgi:hypothetical protein
MSGVLRNLITASMCRSELGGNGAKSTTWPYASFRYRDARSLKANAKYVMDVMPLMSPTVGGGDVEDAGIGDSDEGGAGGRRLQRWSRVSRRRARATGRRKRSGACSEHETEEVELGLREHVRRSG